MSLYLGSALVFITVIATIIYYAKVENILELQKKQEALITSLLIWAVSIVLVGILGFSLSKQFLRP